VHLQARIDDEMISSASTATTQATTIHDDLPSRHQIM